MYRRFAIFAVLLVALSGIASAWACAAIVEQHHCCPGGMPCDQHDAPRSMPDHAICCAAAPSQSQPALSRIQDETSADLPTQDHSPDIAPPPLLRPASAAPDPPPPPHPDAHSLDHSQSLYLRLGRLRL